VLRHEHNDKNYHRVWDVDVLHVGDKVVKDKFCHEDNNGDHETNNGDHNTNEKDNNDGDDNGHANDDD
jgi:hypothetical protein